MMEAFKASFHLPLLSVCVVTKLKDITYDLRKCICRRGTVILQKPELILDQRDREESE